MQIQTKTKLKPAGMAVGMFAVLVLAMSLCPTASNFAQAWTENAEDAIAKSNLTTSARLWNKPTLSVALADAVNLEVIPKSTSTFVSSSADLTVETNSINGADLSSGDQSVTKSIKPLSNKSTSAEFDDNTWGYYIGEAAVSDSTIYAPVPTTTTEVFSTDTSGSRENYNVAFGAKVDTNLPAGVYSNSVLVSVVANPIAVTLENINYMQEMQPSICEATTTGSTKQLIDSRDNKSYWVTKLNDDRCWMVQNLALDLDTDESGNAVAVAEDGTKNTLTNSNTDIDTNHWNAETGSMPIVGADTVPDARSGDNTAVKFWKSGKILYKNPNNITACQSKLAAGDNLSTLPSVCPEFFMTVTADMTSGYPATSSSSYDEATNSYDSHYLIGNWYSYPAATAGTSPQITEDNLEAPGSICPKGWALPTRSQNPRGLSARISRAGYINAYYGSFAELGSGYGYWFSTASSTSRAYFFKRIGNNTEDTTENYYIGMSIRCINQQ